MIEAVKPPETLRASALKPQYAWNPDQRHDVFHDPENGLFTQLIHSSEADQAAIEAYFKFIRTRYFIPGHAMTAVENAIFATQELSQHLFSLSEDEEVMRQFEQDYLGLEPTPQGGIRWWASAAGGASGIYPTEAIAAILDIEVEEFLDYIKANKKMCNHVGIFADDYLILLSDNPVSNEVVTIGYAYLLTTAGKEFIEAIIGQYWAGLKKGAEHPELLS